MTLESFCEHNMAREAQLTRSEVAAIRLYSGPMFAPINYALRTERIDDWATTIACCYSGVLKLSFISQPGRVYRGVREDAMRLPPEFLSREEGKFAGGVERAFMSTTRSPAVALDYSGGQVCACACACAFACACVCLVFVDYMFYNIYEAIADASGLYDVSVAIHCVFGFHKFLSVFTVDFSHTRFHVHDGVRHAAFAIPWLI